MPSTRPGGAEWLRRPVKLPLGGDGEDGFGSVGVIARAIQRDARPLSRWVTQLNLGALKVVWRL